MQSNEFKSIGTAIGRTTKDETDCKTCGNTGHIHNPRRSLQSLRTEPIWVECPDHKEKRLARQSERNARMANWKFNCSRCGEEIQGADDLCAGCKLQEDTERYERMVARLQTLSEIPAPLLEACTFDKFDTQMQSIRQIERETLIYALNYAREYAKDTEFELPAWLWLEGDVGTGKTHLAVAIMNSLMKRRIFCRFAFVPDMLDRWRASYSDHNDESFHELYGSVADAECLVLDDLHPMAMTDWATDKLFTLLNHRYSSRMKTIITTNIQTTKIPHSDRWSALYSRLNDGEVVEKRLLAAPDYRRMRSSYAH